MEVAAFQVKRNVRSAIGLLHMEGLKRCLIETASSIFRSYWPNCITNGEVLRRAEIVQVEIRIRRRKWAWIGHPMRKDEDNIARMAMEWKPFDGLRRALGGQKRLGKFGES